MNQKWRDLVTAAVIIRRRVPATSDTIFFSLNLRAPTRLNSVTVRAWLLPSFRHAATGVGGEQRGTPARALLRTMPALGNDAFPHRDDDPCVSATLPEVRSRRVGPKPSLTMPSSSANRQMLPLATPDVMKDDTSSRPLPSKM